MDISVITPSYNQGAFLGDTIASVLAQERAADEYIIVDGASTDSTVGVLARARPLVTRVVSEPDGGQAEAINKGVQIASGDVIGWLNSDDCYFPWTLATVQRVFEQNPDAAVVYGDYVKIDASNRLLALRRQPSFNASIARNGYLTVMQPSAFFRRQAFCDVGGVDISLRYAMDYDLWLKLASVGRIVHVREYLSAFRLHEVSKSVAERGNFRAENRLVQARHGLQHAEWKMLVLARVNQVRAAVRMAREGCWGSRLGHDEQEFFAKAVKECSDISGVWKCNQRVVA